jgi:predicted nucleic acid-binding protein
MNRVVISDANIFIDLLAFDLISFLFALEFEIVTTQEVFDELIVEQQATLIPYISTERLTIISLKAPNFTEISLLQASGRLSFTDHTILYWAEKLPAMVLTGDKLLRKACERQKLEVHGILWLFDRFLDAGLFDKNAAKNLLTELMQFNPWLPKEACIKKLKEWE